MAITSGNFAKLLQVGLKKVFGDEYREYDQEWRKIYEVQKSIKAFEEMLSMTGFGMFAAQPEGTGVTYDTQQQGFTTRFNHVDYGLGFIITRNMVDDDQYDRTGARMTKGLGYSGRQTVETVAANVLNRAFNTTYVGGDAATLIASAGGGGSATHPNVSGGTWTNGPATAADPSEAAVEQACIDIANFTDDRGKKMRVMPKQIICAPNQEFEFHRILKSTLQSDSAENNDNALRSLKKIPGGILVNHYLTDTDAWFIQTDCPNGMIFFERRAMDFTSDNDFDTGNIKNKADCRFSVGWGDARCMWGSPGA